jgi:hypothetical protein
MDSLYGVCFKRLALLSISSNGTGLRVRVACNRTQAVKFQC